LQKILTLYNNPKPVDKKRGVAIATPPRHSADAGAIGVAHPVSNFILDKVENARPAVTTAEPPPIKLAVGFRRFGGVGNKVTPAAPAFDAGEVVGGGVVGGVSVHLEDSMPLRATRLALHLYFGMIPRFF